MSRDSSGTYSLPGGNPVITGSTISSSWANSTLNDIATALTDSLSRSGLGGMTAGLELFDGTSALPGLTWGTETTSGLYRAAAEDFRWVISASEVLQITPNLFKISGSAPIFRMDETDAGANDRLWDVITTSGEMRFRTLTDALVSNTWLSVIRNSGTGSVNRAVFGTGVSVRMSRASSSPGTDDTLLLESTSPRFTLNNTNASVDERMWSFTATGAGDLTATLNTDVGVGSIWLSVTRTTNICDSINFISTALNYNGSEVGLRTWPMSVDSGSRVIPSSDSDKVVNYTGGAGSTFTFGNLTASSRYIIVNSGTGALTISSSSGSLNWFGGAGAIPTGNRTLAIGGQAWVYRAAGNWFIWGVGIT